MEQASRPELVASKKVLGIFEKLTNYIQNKVRLEQAKTPITSPMFKELVTVDEKSRALLKDILSLRKLLDTVYDTPLLVGKEAYSLARVAKVFHEPLFWYKINNQYLLPKDLKQKVASYLRILFKEQGRRFLPYFMPAMLPPMWCLEPDNEKRKLIRSFFRWKAYSSITFSRKRIKNETTNTLVVSGPVWKCKDQFIYVRNPGGFNLLEADFPPKPSEECRVQLFPRFDKVEYWASTPYWSAFTGKSLERKIGMDLAHESSPDQTFKVTDGNAWVTIDYLLMKTQWFPGQNPAPDITWSLCPEHNKVMLTAITNTPKVGIRISHFSWEHILDALNVCKTYSKSSHCVLGIRDSSNFNSIISRASLVIFSRVKNEQRAIALISETHLFGFTLVEG